MSRAENAPRTEFTLIRGSVEINSKIASALMVVVKARGTMNRVIQAMAITIIFAPVRFLLAQPRPNEPRIMPIPDAESSKPISVGDVFSCCWSNRLSPSK